MADIEAIGSSQFGNFSNINTGKNYQRYGSNTSLMATPSTNNAFVQDGTGPNGNPAWSLWATTFDGALRQFTTTYPAAFAATGTTVFSVYVATGSRDTADITIRNSSSKATICAAYLNTTSGTLTLSTNTGGGTKVFVDRVTSGNSTWNRISFVMTGYTGSFEAFFDLGNLGFNSSFPASKYMMYFSDWQLEYERDRATSYSRTEDVAPTQNNPGARANVYTPDPKAVGETTFDAFCNTSVGRNLLANSGQSNLVLRTTDFTYAGNSVIGPFGSNTGDVYTTNSSGSAARFLTNATGITLPVNGSGYTLSFYVLSATNYLYFQLLNNAGSALGSAYLDLAALEVALLPEQSANEFNKLTFKIEDAGSNWRRISVSFKGVTDSGIRWIMAPSDSTDSFVSTAPTGTPLIYTDAWQFENNETASAYDPTGASAPNATTQGAYARRAPTALATGNSVVPAFQNGSNGTNLIPRSGDSSAIWIQRGTVYTATDNVIDAPTGAMQGDAFRATSSGSAQRLVTLQHANLVCDGTPYTFSVFVKSSHRYIYFAVDNTNRSPYTLPFEAYFDLQNLVAQPVNASRDAGFSTSYQITDAGDGWRRISATFTANIPVGMCGYILPADSFNVASSNDTANTVAMYLDGTQYERGTKLSPYNKTGTTVPSSAPGATGTLGPAPRFATGDVTIGAFRNTTSGRNTFANSGTPTISASLNNAYSVSENLSTATAVPGEPTLTGDQFVALGTGSALRYVNYGMTSVIPSRGSMWTYSYYISMPVKRYFYFGVNNNGGSIIYGEVYFDTQTTTFGGNTPSRDSLYGTTYSITNVGEGWFRISMSFNAPTGVGLRFYLTPCEAMSGTPSSMANSGQVLFRGDGFQAEEGPVATKYEKTEATAPIMYSGASARVIGMPINADGVSTFGAFTNQSVTRNVFPNSGNASLYTLLTLYTSAAFTITDNVIDAPTGAMQGDRFTTTGAGTGRRYANVDISPATDGRRMTISFYVKTARAFFYIGIDNRNAQPVPSEASFNLSTLTVTPWNTSRDATYGTTYSVIDVGDGWRRISTTFTPSVGLNLRLYLSPADAALSYSYNASAGDVFYFDGMQVEYNSEPTAYQKTGATAPSTVPGATGQLGAMPLDVTIAQTVGPFTSNSAALRIPVLDATGDMTFGKFYNVSEGYNIFAYSSALNFNFIVNDRIDANVASSPLGASRADAHVSVEAGDRDRILFYRGAALTVDGGDWVFSFYAKTQQPYLTINIGGAAAGSDRLVPMFDTQTGTLKKWWANTPYSQYEPSVVVYPFADGWARYSLAFKNFTTTTDTLSFIVVAHATEFNTRSNVPANGTVVLMDGFQLERGRIPRAYQETTTPVPNQNVQGARAEIIYPTLLANAETALDTFTSNGASMYVNLARATQPFPGPFTQEAAGGYAPLSMSGNSTFGEFTMNAGKATSFYGRSAINVGRASTTREVFHPANLKVGDLIVLIAGSHSDGYDDIDLDADSDFKLQGMVRGPSVRPGYRQSLWMWTKEATAEDVMATVYYNLPSNYTDPVVWAQSYVFNNAARVEGFVSHVDAEDTFYSASPQVSSFNAGRTAVLVWQASTVTSTSGPGFWEASTQSSSIGPGFTTVIEYASLKEANTLSKTRSWGAPTKAMAVGFSVVPGGSEGGVLIQAIGNSTIDAFRSIKDIKSETETTFDNFVSVGRQIMAVEGDQKIAPFTSNSVGNVVVSANANTTATAFGSFTSRGFETIALYGNSRVPAFTSNASILSRSTISGRSFFGEFTANAAANVFIGLTGTSQIEPFTSDRVMVYSNTAVTVGEYVSNAVARALVMANTANVAMGAFTSNTTAGPIVQATSNTLLADFIANSIYTEASAISAVGTFSANTVAQAIVSANTISSFDNFTQEAGNVIFIRDNVPMEEFTSNATGEVLILANAVTDLGEFTFTPRPGTRVRNIVSSRGAMRMTAVTQQVIMEFVEPTREATGESSFGEFGSEGSARVLTRSLEHGGVKFKGSFKGGLSNGSPNIRISGRKRI